MESFITLSHLCLSAIYFSDTRYFLDKLYLEETIVNNSNNNSNNTETCYNVSILSIYMNNSSKQL